MSDNVYIKVTVGRAYNKVGRYDIVVDAVNDNDEQVKNPVRLYLEAEADGVIVCDGCQEPQTTVLRIG